MMEVKFRAWVVQDNEFGSLPYMATQGEPDIETLQSFMHHYSDQKLMISSGIPDVNGKLIFQCDILEVGDPIDFVGYSVAGTLRKGKKYRVFFNDGAFLFAKSNRAPTRRLTSSIVRANGLKVVGNIYEDAVCS